MTSSSTTSSSSLTSHSLSQKNRRRSLSMCVFASQDVRSVTAMICHSCYFFFLLSFFLSLLVCSVSVIKCCCSFLFCFKESVSLCGLMKCLEKLPLQWHVSLLDLNFGRALSFSQLHLVVSVTERPPKAWRRCVKELSRRTNTHIRGLLFLSVSPSLSVSRDDECGRLCITDSF